MVTTDKGLGKIADVEIQGGVGELIFLTENIGTIVGIGTRPEWSANSANGADFRGG
jgi:hypothetical protein